MRQPGWSDILIGLSLLAGVAMFFVNLMIASAAHTEQLNSVMGDVNGLKQAVPRMEKSLSRIEGKLGIYDHYTDETQYGRGK